ncbi:SDR family NAD(P)-dependent oxidoreductase [Acuticoccus sediminis]|uniref:SDR family NAD(P)-dependent oxidoreductase n=1 Tax=Acuticoccus sediminis TaxID=2184697 RepID=UPI0013909CF3|nr:SDR family oxidoreductase [Acuticoccus sediminis]
MPSTSTPLPPVPLVDIEGLRLLVFGAGSGIGAATVSLGRAAGARVAAGVHGAAGEPTGPAAFDCDVTDPAAVARTVAAAGEALGGLDAVVVSSGVFHLGDVSHTGDEDWARVMSVNLTGPFHVARAVAPVFEAAGGGSLVLVSSQIGFIGHRRATSYAASKAGVNGLTRTLAIEFSSFGARCNAVAPGPIETPMTEVARSDPDRLAAMTAGVPLGRLGRPEEAARAALFLAAPASSFVTGHVLVVDGGILAG